MNQHTIQESKSGIDDNYPFVIAKLSEHLNETKRLHLEEIKTMQQKHEEALNKQIKEHANQIADLKMEQNIALSDLEFRFKTSLTWRIGSVILNIVKFIRNFLYNPIRFFSSSSYRFKDLEPKPRKELIAYSRTQTEKISVKPQEKLTIDKNKLTILGIFDTFTYNCFKYEFNIINPTPETWQNIMPKYKIDALFIESAWVGNNESWRYQIGKYNNEENRKLKELITESRKKKIPVIFWNKEDPVHFDHFLVAAKLADLIFTSDADCIPKYKKEVGHDRVFALPFAAQEIIHNPVRIGQRTGNVCFAGTYYSQRYPDRKDDMETILIPALDFDLDIYDRNLGRTDKNAEQLRFPDIYKSAVKGKLEYDQMLEAYKQYKVFLNVNSVRESPTMFARRVFELLACGTPVISTYSKGIISILGEETVLIAENESDTRNHLNKLLNDEHYWWKKSLEGLRIVHESHTYHHRAKYILDKAGLRLNEKSSISFLVLAQISSNEELDYLLEILKEQHYQNFDILLVLKDKEQAINIDQEKINAIFPEKRVKTYNNTILMENIEILNEYKGNYVALFNLNNFYGKNYLRDYALAINYSGAESLGKKSHFIFNGNEQILLTNKGCEYNYMADVPTSSLVIHKAKLDINTIKSLLYQDTFFDFEIRTLSIDPFNLILNGRTLEKTHQLRVEI